MGEHLLQRTGQIIFFIPGRDNPKIPRMTKLHHHLPANPTGVEIGFPLLLICAGAYDGDGLELSFPLADRLEKSAAFGTDRRGLGRRLNIASGIDLPAAAKQGGTHQIA